MKEWCNDMKSYAKKIAVVAAVALTAAVSLGAVAYAHSQAPTSGAAGQPEETGASVTADTEDTKVVVNELSSGVTNTGFFSLSPENYHEYTKEELFDHYGIEFDVADIFPDMVEENTDSYGIYTFSDGRDMQGHNFIWTNAGNGEEIDIEIIKDGTPKTDVNLADGGTPAQSTISGKSVTIFHFDTDGQTGYYAEFEYKDLSFSVYGYNLGEEDFISLLSYLLSR